MTWSTYEIEVRDLTTTGLTGTAGAGVLQEWGKVVEEVRLEKEYPDTEIVVIVREHDETTNTDLRWGRSYRIWGGSWGWGPAPTQTPADAIAAVIYSHILEANTTVDE